MPLDAQSTVVNNPNPFANHYKEPVYNAPSISSNVHHIPQFTIAMYQDQDSFSSDANEQIRLNPRIQICKSRARSSAEIEHKILTENKKRTKPNAPTRVTNRRQASNKRSAEICRIADKFYTDNLEKEISRDENISRNTLSAMSRMQAEMCAMRNRIEQLKCIERNTMPQSWLHDNLIPCDEMPDSDANVDLIDCELDAHEFEEGDDKCTSDPVTFCTNERCIDLNMKIMEEDTTWFTRQRRAERVIQREVHTPIAQIECCPPKRTNNRSPVSIFGTAHIDIPIFPCL